MSNITNIRNKIRQHFKNKKEEHDRQRANRRQTKWSPFYQSHIWQVLRARKKLEQPICEICERQGRIVAADSIHHLYVWGNAKTEEDKWRYFTDYSLLCSVCTHHHHLFHQYMNDNGLDYCSIDTLIDYENTLNSYDK